MYLSKKASDAQLRAAERARRNRQEIIRGLCEGTVSRRELIKWGLFTASGVLAAKHGLNPFVASAYAGLDVAPTIPTGSPPSSLDFGRGRAEPFTQPMPRFDVLQPKPVSALSPAPRREANTDPQVVAAELGGGYGPVEGRPPGPIWAHQGWDLFPPTVAYEVGQTGIRHSGENHYYKEYNPQVAPAHNCGINPTQTMQTCFHANLPDQDPKTLWTFNGSLPPKLLLARYGDSILFRHHNDLPLLRTDNGGFGMHTITTHRHNGHHGAESDGFTGAFFFPGQFYDYHWPMVLAGFKTINPDATDIRAGRPDGKGGIDKIPGDWRETMSTHWFHDHMFSFTSQNVYKGIAAMFNIYSALDRGYEGPTRDGVNLRLPSGTAKDWGNLEYDVNLMLADKAWGQDGQMIFDIFDFDGFVGDQMTVNLAWKPYFEVERRKYRFRILNGAVARFFTLALSDGSPMIQIGNDGNLLPRPVVLSRLDQLGIAERYDIVIDFSRYQIGSRVHLVNLAEVEDGRRVEKDLSLAEALEGESSDPCVGRFLEFRVVRNPAEPDLSQVPSVLIPNPDLSRIPVARQRVFEFGRGAKQSGSSSTTGLGPWGIRTEGGDMLAADYGRVTAAPRVGTREIWTLRNGGGGWDHPLHIHFEEGQVLARDGKASNVPPWERGRKDVYRLRPGGSITITMQFRDFGGMFMEHCHNTVHEDNAMLLRWDVDGMGTPFLRPLPTPIPTPQGVRFQATTELPKA